MPSGCNSFTKHRSSGLPIVPTTCKAKWTGDLFDLAYTTALQNRDTVPNSEEEPPMSSKLKSGLVFGAIVLFFVAAQAGLIVTPGA